MTHKIHRPAQFIALIFTACSTYSALTPPVNHNGPLRAGTPAECHAMCENLRALHCPAGDPTPKGAPCEDVCNNAESSGYASENPTCQARVHSCEAADACPDEALNPGDVTAPADASTP